jgi:hypothetical protein
LLALLYYKVSVYLLQGGGNAASGGNDSAYSQKSHQHDEHKGLLHPSPSNSLSRYQDWRCYAVELAALSPNKIVSTLKTLDPFGVWTFETKLQPV